MNDSNEQNAAEMSPVVSIGTYLKSAREAKNLDVDDICSYLRLSRRQVLALENDDFLALPEATITRGFIRNYARMLELDAEPLLEAYRNFTASEQPRPISIQSENIRIPGNDKRPWVLYVFASVLIVLLVTAWVVYVDYMPKPSAEVQYVPSETEVEAAVSNVESIPAPFAAPDSAPNEPLAADTSLPTDAAAPADSSTDGSTAAPATDVEPVTTQPTAILPGMAVVKLLATERSWVSITDRNNKNIFDKIMIAGIEESVQGEPPLQVVIGNAPSTTLVFNNKTIDLVSVTHDRVARLKLE
jgi:cytoskeleton protein RodZ